MFKKSHVFNENKISYESNLLDIFLENIFKNKFKVIKSTNSYDNRKLKNISSFIKDGTHGSYSDSKGPLLLSAKNLKNNLIVFNEKDRHISSSDYENIYSNYSLKDNDILISIVGTLGNVAMFSTEKYPKMAFQRSVAFVRTNKLKPKYLFYYFKTQKFKYDLNKVSTTSAQTGVYLNDLGNINIAFDGSKENQTKFVKLLDNISELLRLSKKNNENAKKLKKHLMQNMFI